MSAASHISAATPASFRRRFDRRYSFVIQSLGLVTSSITARTFHIGAITTEQHPHMHFVSFGFEPAEKSTHTVPTVVLVIVVGIYPAAFFAINDEILIGFGQFLERPVNIDFFARTAAQQIFL